jgi:hypothetical protein
MNELGRQLVEISKLIVCAIHFSACLRINKREGFRTDTFVKKAAARTFNASAIQ